MKNINDILFIVQAREGSTRIENKMTREFNGTNLFTHCLRNLKSTIIPHSQLYASVGEENLIKCANQEGVQIFQRSIESAGESHDLLKIFEWNKLDYKYYILVSACCPFLSPETINGFINNFLSSKHDGVMSVIKKKNIIWDANMDYLNKRVSDDFQTQTLPHYYEAAHCLYAGSMDRLRDERIHMGTFMDPNDPATYTIPESEAFDIDEMWQFELAYKKFI